VTCSQLCVAESPWFAMPWERCSHIRAQAAVALHVGLGGGPACLPRVLWRTPATAETVSTHSVYPQCLPTVMQPLRSHMDNSVGQVSEPHTAPQACITN
jgi:hypothetical protein